MHSDTIHGAANQAHVAADMAEYVWDFLCEVDWIYTVDSDFLAGLAVAIGSRDHEPDMDVAVLIQDDIERKLNDYLVGEDGIATWYEGNFEIALKSDNPGLYYSLMEEALRSDETEDARWEYCEWTGQERADLDEQEFDEAYHGAWESEREFAEQYAEDCGFLDADSFRNWPGYYIDWDRATDELFLQDFWSAEPLAANVDHRKIYVFRSL